MIKKVPGFDKIDLDKLIEEARRMCSSVLPNSRLLLAQEKDDALDTFIEFEDACPGGLGYLFSYVMLAGCTINLIDESNRRGRTDDLLVYYRQLDVLLKEIFNFVVQIKESDITPATVPSKVLNQYKAVGTAEKKMRRECLDAVEKLKFLSIIHTIDQETYESVNDIINYVRLLEYKTNILYGLLSQTELADDHSLHEDIENHSDEFFATLDDGKEN